MSCWYQAEIHDFLGTTFVCTPEKRAQKKTSCVCFLTDEDVWSCGCRRLNSFSHIVRAPFTIYLRWARSGNVKTEWKQQTFDSVTAHTSNAHMHTRLHNYKVAGDWLTIWSTNETRQKKLVPMRHNPKRAEIARVAIKAFIQSWSGFMPFAQLSHNNLGCMQIFRGYWLLYRITWMQIKLKWWISPSYSSLETSCSIASCNYQRENEMSMFIVPTVIEMRSKNIATDSFMRFCHWFPASHLINKSERNVCRGKTVYCLCYHQLSSINVSPPPKCRTS